MTGEHDKTGLIRKYYIFKTDGDGPPDKRMRFEETGDRNPHKTYSVPLWFKRTWSFVLSPEKDDAYGEASRDAMLAYANAIQPTNPQLADDMRMKVTEIEHRIREKKK